MESSKRCSTSRLRGARGAVAACLILLILTSGCATQVPPGQLAGFEEKADQIALWSRNPIVCAPTAIGNAMGGVLGYPFALIAFGPAWLAGLGSDDENFAFRIYGTAFWFPVLIFGGLTGSLFLPMSYAIGEHPCDLGLSSGWPEPAPPATAEP